jgi:chromate transporter
MFLELVTLFWIFFKIGLFTFGGGYAMIPLIESELVGKGYISVELLYDFIGISESTPGPIAINMATFIGNDVMKDYGFLARILGSMATTIGVALPSFIIILLIASLGSGFLNSRFVKEVFKGLKPAVIGLILSVTIALIFRSIFPMIHFSSFDFNFEIFNFKNLIIFIVIIIVSLVYKKLSPIQMILLSALMGILIYSVL